MIGDLIKSIGGLINYLGLILDSEQGVVDFTASWCGPCRMIAPIFAEQAKKHPSVVFLKVDVDELKSVADEFNVQAMPTFIFLKNGKVVHTMTGADKEGLIATINNHIGHVVAAA